MLGHLIAPQASNFLNTGEKQLSKVNFTNYTAIYFFYLQGQTKAVTLNLLSEPN